MAELEKAIYDIERCICHVPDACKDCSKFGRYNAIRCMEELLTDALSLLKAQEPVEPVIKPIAAKDSTNCTQWYACRDCGASIDPDDKYCRRCGRAVKWDE